MPGTNLVMIGVSTGGPLALRSLLNDLPPLDAAVVIVLHIAPGMDQMIARGLNGAASMPVAVAENGESLRSGTIYLAPGGSHLTLEGNRRVVLFEGGRINFVQPSVDVAMKSLQRMHHNKLVGIILTGMGKDGAEGIRHVKAMGGVTMAQDQASCAIFGMPRAAVQTGAVDHVCSPQQMGARLLEIVGPL